MKNRNGFLNFLLACMPGAGFMYNGLMRSGAELMLLFIGVMTFSDMSGIGFVGILSVPIWFYSFFKTFEIARRIDRGEIVEDKSIFFGEGNVIREMDNNSGLKIVAILLIVFGSISLLNKVFQQFNIYYQVRGYLAPIFFIGIGAYILLKRKN